MGFIRGALIVILSTILFFALFAGGLFLTLSWSLEHDTLKPEIQNISGELIQQYGVLNIIEENKGMLELYCQATDSFYINEQGIELDIPCSILLAETSVIIDYAVENIFDQIYYKEYSCSLWSCIKEEALPTVLISEKAQNYWKSKFYLVMFLAIVCFILMFIVARHKATPFITTGILAMVAALPFKKLEFLLGLIPEATIAKVAGIFITKSPNVFWTFIIIGIIFFLIGLTMKFLKMGLKVSHWFTKKESAPEDDLSKKDVKNIVKKAIKKDKKQEKKPKEKKKTKDLTEDEEKEEKLMPSKKELMEVFSKKKKK